MSHDDSPTRDAGYTSRLMQLEGARWKKLLDVQAPYRRNLHRLLGGRAVLDVGCGIGRNLAQLGPGSVGVDHNADSVRICRERGLAAQVPDEFFGSAYAVPGSFTGLLAAHVVEHLEPGTAPEVLRPYLACLAPQARVVLICPQQRGFASDATHTEYYDLPALAALCGDLDLEVESRSSFPFPTWAGRLFTYNEFVTVARTSSARS